MRGDETPTEVVTKEDTIDEGYDNTPPEENTDSPSWAHATEEQRATHLGNMVVECVRGIGQNNPVMWVWAPTGLGAEISLLWRQAMDEALAEHPVAEESPMRRMYYPEVREHEKCRIPNNLTLPHRGAAR